MRQSDDAATPGSWFLGTGRVTAPARLFYFPQAGGNPSTIVRWQAQLGTSVELLVAVLPGHGARLLDEPLSELDELVAHLTSAVAALADRRFAFLGHSLGALLAFEIARALRRQGSPMPECLWACGAEGPQTRLVDGWLHDLPPAEFVQALRDYGGTNAQLLDDPEVMELLSPGIRADFRLGERYAYRPEPPLDLPIHVLRGDQDPQVDAGRAAGWALETTRPGRERVYPGDHFFVEPHGAEIAALVVASLASEPASEPASERASPYRSLPPRSFWRTAAAEPDVAEISDVWQPKFAIGQDTPILTAGSCFARQIGRALLEAGMNWLDAEPAPPGLTAAQRAARHYGEFSFRTGNIYTAAMLRQWLSWALGDGAAVPVGAVLVGAAPVNVWTEGAACFDPYRPSVEPGGYPTADAVLAAREVTLAAIRDAVARAGCLVFTLGLTEAWHDTDDGTVYPVCPGTVRGTFDERRHVFRNATFADVYSDLAATVDLARAANPDLRVLLTVSPVPLTATATGGHALVATTYSKSVLRAAAGQLAAELACVDYFPSYELITGSPFGARFFEKNLRTVTAEGVAFVLRHFLDAFGPQAAGSAATVGGPIAPPKPPAGGGDPDCDDAVLDYYRAG